MTTPNPRQLAHALVLLGAISAGSVAAEDTTAPLFRDTRQPIERRVADLISRMTLEEKAAQMMNAAPAIPRLGIPAYDWWNECLHGVARAGTATVFPQAIGYAATWDQDLVRRMADVISTEARAKHHDALRRRDHSRYTGLTFWSPNVNIFRDPRWGRGQETYGEDPYLTGRIGAAFVKGLQGDDPRYLKVIATPKHYAVHSGPEPLRHAFDARTSGRDLWETYLPAFEATLREAGAFSVMCAYNRYEGQPACASETLLGDVLRKQWGFPGYVVSDCGAITNIWRDHKYVETPEAAAAVAVQRGCDLECGWDYRSLARAAHEGLVSEAQLDVSLARLFTARFRLGMFDPPEDVPYARIPISANDAPEHRSLARRVAQSSIVLLKNSGNLLPLKKDVGTVAVIGPNADSVRVLLGNYNGTPSSPVTALEGIRSKIPDAQVLYAPGSALADGLPSLLPAGLLAPAGSAGTAHGLTAEYFDNPNLQGTPRVRRVDETVDFVWRSSDPAPGVGRGAFSVRWSGSLVPERSGTVQLGVAADGSMRLWVDDRLVIDAWGRRTRRRTELTPVDLVAGRRHSLKLEYAHTGYVPSVRLVWIDPQLPEILRAAAVRVARRAEIAVLVLGISAELEGEEMNVSAKGFAGGDRTSLDLPATQQELLQAVHATGTPLVLVLMSGSALSVNWAAENVPAILEAWYGGEEAGSALADVLFGDVSPAGRLPVTFYRSVDQLPPFEDYAMAGRTYRYFRGQPLFPFGHGLSYTRFHYSDLKLVCACGHEGGCARKRCPAERGLRAKMLAEHQGSEPAVAGLAKPAGGFRPDEDFTVSVTVHNVGPREGDEVVQLYVRDIVASLPVPIRSLMGFQRVHLAAGERRTISFTLQPVQLGVVQEDGRRLVEPGAFEVSVGGKQPGFTGLADAPTTEALTAQFQVVAAEQAGPAH